MLYMSKITRFSENVGNYFKMQKQGYEVIYSHYKTLKLNKRKIRIKPRKAQIMNSF